MDHRKDPIPGLSVVAPGEATGALIGLASPIAQTELDDIPDDASTSELIVAGSAVDSTIDFAGDRDWFRLDVEAGTSYRISLDGGGAPALSDPFLRVFDENGRLVASDDDGGVGLNSNLVFTPTTDGVLFLEAASFNDQFSGGYRLSVASGESPGDTVDTVPADTTTTETVETGEVYDGRLDSRGDRDWIRLEVVAGETYSIAVDGAGFDALADPYLRVYDASGTLLLENDDGGPGVNAFAAYTATETGVVYISVGAYNDAGVGDYAVTVSEFEAPDLVDAIDWGTRLTQGDPIQIYFAPSGVSVDGVLGNVTSEGFSASEIATQMEVFDQVSSFTTLTFERTTSAANADLTIAADDLGPSLLGYFGPPDIGVGENIGVLHTSYSGWTQGLEQGGFGYGVIIHEFGHALGLAHTHDNGGGSQVFPGVGSSSDLGAADLNQTVYSVMSYNDGWTTAPHGVTPSLGYGYAGTFSAIDIAALQADYGVNDSFNAGDDVYELPSSNAVGTFYATIWDAGGVDVIRQSANLDTIIDLRPATLKGEAGGGGTISYGAGIHGGFTIADGANIENATSAGGDDTLTGNSLDNVLDSGAGNDQLDGLNGADILRGGAGDDTLNGGGGFDTLVGGAGRDDIRGGGGFAKLDYGQETGDASRVVLNLATGVATDTFGDRDAVRNVTHVVGSDRGDLLVGAGRNETLDGGAGPDALVGKRGDDTLVGGDGADNINGGDGDDIIFGDAQSVSGSVAGVGDTLAGRAGNDTIYGGGGADLIIGQQGDDILSGGKANDNIAGGDGVDRLLGQAGDDRLNGGADDDTLLGGDGDDRLLGGNGEDRLEGGAGDDFLNGAGDADVFVYRPGAGDDEIKGYQDGVDAFELIGTTARSFSDIAVTQQGSDTLISFDDVTIRLLNRDAGLIDADDFTFA